MSVDPKELEDIKTSLKKDDCKIRCFTLELDKIRRTYNYMDEDRNKVLEELKADVEDGVVDNKYIKYFSKIDYCYGILSIDEIKKIYKESKNIENVDRLYYRMQIKFYQVDSTDILDDNTRYGSSSESRSCIDSVIKFVDL